MRKSVFCINCGLENSADSRFCIGCGSKLEIVFSEPAEEKKDIPVINAGDETIAIKSEKNEDTVSPDGLFTDSAPAFEPADDNTVSGAYGEMPALTEIESVPAFSDSDAAEGDAVPAFSEAEDDASASSTASDELDKTVSRSRIEPLGAPAFSSVSEEKKDDTPVKTEAVSKVKIVYDEDDFAFASGLPEWNLEPPQVMVRRRKD